MDGDIEGLIHSAHKDCAFLTTHRSGQKLKHLIVAIHLVERCQVFVLPRSQTQARRRVNIKLRCSPFRMTSLFQNISVLRPKIAPNIVRTFHTTCIFKTNTPKPTRLLHNHTFIKRVSTIEQIERSRRRGRFWLTVTHYLGRSEIPSNQHLCNRVSFWSIDVVRVVSPH